MSVFPKLSLRSWQNSGSEAVCWKTRNRELHSPSLSHTYVPIGLFWQACHHPPSSSCRSLGGLQDWSASSDWTIQNMRKSRENVYLLSDGKGRRKETGADAGSRGSSGGWHCKTTRWNGFTDLTNKGWLHRQRWTTAVTGCFKTPGWRMLSSQRGGSVTQCDLLKHIKMISVWEVLMLNWKLPPRFSEHILKSWIHPFTSL